MTFCFIVLCIYIYIILWYDNVLFYSKINCALLYICIICCSALPFLFQLCFFICIYIHIYNIYFFNIMYIVYCLYVQYVLFLRFFVYIYIYIYVIYSLDIFEYTLYIDRYTLYLILCFNIYIYIYFFYVIYIILYYIFPRHLERARTRYEVDGRQGKVTPPRGELFCLLFEWTMVKKLFGGSFFLVVWSQVQCFYQV